MKIYLKADAYIIPGDISNVPTYQPALGILDLSDRPGFRVTDLTQEYVKSMTQNRTIEGRLVTDMVNRFRTWVISWHKIDFDLFYQIKKFVDAQCDKLYCLQFHIDAECSNCVECGECNDNCDWISVWVEHNALKYYKDGGKSVEDFELTVIESLGGCGDTNF